MDKQIVKHAECFMLPDANGQLLLNIRYILAENLIKDFIWRITILAEINHRNVTYLNATIDYCESSIAPNHYVLRFISEEIHRVSNMPAECPLKANVMYEVLNYTIDSKYAKMLPSLKWMAFLKFYSKNKNLLNLRVFGSLNKL